MHLAYDDDMNVWLGTAGSFGSVFPNVPDKEKAWEDLIRLTQDKRTNVGGLRQVRLGLHFPMYRTKKKRGKTCIV